MLLLMLLFLFTYFVMFAATHNLLVTRMGIPKLSGSHTLYESSTSGLFFVFPLFKTFIFISSVFFLLCITTINKILYAHLTCSGSFSRLPTLITRIRRFPKKKLKSGKPRPKLIKLHKAPRLRSLLNKL